ncbi:phenylalanine--tRNA ligase subunit beta [Nakamurella deserti]|uniref:phenylalanine--tRNA ligase subunit beta n=1 Tax=Nakamurella deserti TaxID=2164074 RepID=UPI000DBE404A|nr:phenylalanine--tRNA ligase subunit beta [Nakamurella deserti]
MRAPLEWIRQYVALPDEVGVAEIEAALIRIGHEVEDVHTPPPTTGDLVVARVLAVEELTGFKKPIRFVTLEVGAGLGADGSAERQVICGARNFAVGDLVVAALPGAVLPGDFAIASRSTYGRISDGMICSAAELRVGNDSDGIIVLDADDPAAVIGADARPLVGATDTVLELAITPDRGYALSIRGLARELSAAFEVPFTDVAGTDIRDVAGAPVPWPVTIDDPAGCDRFVVVKVSGVDPSARSPYWMRRRLLAAGIRSISLAVDITNYVMLEVGQPLHAFDAATLAGPITVRRATPGEKLVTLDGVARTLDATDLVVADPSGAISLAGVMGGASTEISETTTEVLIEAAHWTPSVISRTARRRSLTSEASRRFERDVDPAVAPGAAERAAELLVRYGGGHLEPGRTDVGAPNPPATVALPLTEPERLLGRPVSAETAARRLVQVGCLVEASESGDALLVTPPTWRPDLLRPADLVEEIARLDGFDLIGSVLPQAPAGAGLSSAQRRTRAVAADLAAIGLTEVLTFPFIGPRDFVALGIDESDIRRRTATLLNPLDSARPLMRTTMLPGLLEALSRNLARGARDVALFELGLVFLPRPDAPRPPVMTVGARPSDHDLRVLEASVPTQVQHVGAVLTGQWDRAGWWGPGRAADWADAVELARRIGRTAGAELRVETAELAPFHPGRCAGIRVGDWPVGYAGELHPAVIERLGLPARTVALELNLSGFPERRPVVPPVVSSFPPVLQDVALVVADTVPAGRVTEVLRRAGGPLLESVRLFDVYTGDPVPAGHKSLAFALSVRAADRTLTGADAQQVRDAVVEAAAREFGAVLR